MPKGYTYYRLTEISKNKLLRAFPKQYKKLIAHHITEKFGDVDQSDIPSDANVQVIGHADSEDGLEALVVTVNGNLRREDGSIYHITWSLDPAKYKPVDSNKLIMDGNWYRLYYKILISTEPDIELFNKV